MDLKQLTVAYFSPTLSTKRIALYAAWGMELKVPTRMISLLSEKDRSTPHVLEPDELLIFAAPTYHGRLPRIEPALLENITGRGTPAVPIVVYGGRGYDDTLLEMKDLLEMNGFTAIASAAFVAQHSLTPKVAAGRPTKQDVADIVAFGKSLAERVNELDKTQLAQRPPLRLPGNFPYKELTAVPPIAPVSTDDCTLCMLCHRWCPSGAISADNPRDTAAEKCLHCHGCVKRCPPKARKFDHDLIHSRILATEGMFADVEMENETFF